MPGFPILRELDEDRSVLRVEVLGCQAGQLSLPGAVEEAGLDLQAEVRGADVIQMLGLEYGKFTANPIWHVAQAGSRMPRPSGYS